MRIPASKAILLPLKEEPRREPGFVAKIIRLSTHWVVPHTINPKRKVACSQEHDRIDQGSVRVLHPTLSRGWPGSAKAVHFHQYKY
jgi:hypothetical protein